MIKILNSKNYPSGKRDYWWYNLSSPDRWLSADSRISLVMYDSSNEERIGTIILNLNKGDWLERIRTADRHFNRGTEIIKIHVIREYSSKQFYIWFGRTEDGRYRIIPE